MLNVLSRVLSLTTAKEGLSFLSFGSYSTGSQLKWITPKCFPQIFLGFCYYFLTLSLALSFRPSLPPSTWACMHARYVFRGHITWGSVHFFHHRASWDWTQIIRVGSKFLYLLSPILVALELFSIFLYISQCLKKISNPCLPFTFDFFLFQKFNFLKFYMCVGICV